MTAQLIRVKINLTFNSVQKVYNGNSNIWIKSLTFIFGPFFKPRENNWSNFVTWQFLLIWNPKSKPLWEDAGRGGCGGYLNGLIT